MKSAAKSLRRSFLLGAGLLMILAGTSPAFMPVENHAALNVPLPGERDVPQWTTLDAHESPFLAGRSFESRVGGQWHYWWNEATGIAHQAWGPGFQTDAAFIADEATAEAVAREFIADNADIFGTAGANLVTTHVSHGGGKWGVVFGQVHEGLAVIGGRAHVLMTETGVVANFGSDVHPGIAIPLNPAMSGTQALATAQQAVGFVEGRDRVVDAGRMVIVPDPTGGVVTYHLAYENRVNVEEPLGEWRSTVDANTGEILGRWNEVQFLDYSGNSRGDVVDYSYCDGELDNPLTHQYVNITGLGTATTDADGDFLIPSGDTGNKSINAQLFGLYFNINNQLAADATINGVITGGVPFQFNWNDGNSQDDERSVYLHGNRVYDFIKTVDPALNNPQMNELPSNVSISNNCNAFWSPGGSINFYRAGGGCGNTGELGDVIYHEYGHGITQWVYGSNTCDNGESGSDIVAMIIQGEPIIGEGFFLNNCSDGIRTCSNPDDPFTYPEDYSAGSCHNNAQILCGFWYDARMELLDSMSEEDVKWFLGDLWHFSRKNTHPNSYPDQVLLAFITDDDDGNLDNGTPHHAELCVGAENHGFDCPEIIEGVLISHTPLECTEEENVPFDVEATILSTFAEMDPSKVDVFYRVDGGGFTEVNMTEGDENEWSAQIPGQLQPAEIEYYISAEDLLGNIRTAPVGAPAATYAFDVALDYEPMEVANPDWTVGDVDDDATTGLWVRVDPNPTSAQPGDDHTPSGTQCWVTGQGSLGGGDGENDVDGGKTTLFSPSYDLTGATAAKVKYWRWYSNDRGADPGNDDWVVQARNNGGAWVSLETTDVSSNAWVEVEADLIGIFGPGIGTVQVRFIASDENAGSLIEAAVDDFKLLASLGSSGAGEAGSRLAYRLGEATPNPFHPQTLIRFAVPERIQASLKIYGVDGREIRTLVAGTIEAGEHAFPWDSRDSGGRSVSAGVYYYVLDAGSFHATRQMVLLK